MLAGCCTGPVGSHTTNTAGRCGGTEIVELLLVRILTITSECLAVVPGNGTECCSVALSDGDGKGAEVSLNDTAKMKT